jgi:hypothetical protein
MNGLTAQLFIAIISSKFLYEKVMLISEKTQNKGCSLNKSVMMVQVSLGAILNIAVLFYVATK